MQPGFLREASVTLIINQITTTFYSSDTIAVIVRPRYKRGRVGGKTLEYTKSDSQFLPVYVEQEQLEVDVNSVEVMNSFYRPLSQIMSGLNDSLLLAGSEALQAALGYYQSVKQAAKMNIPDAKVIYEDLSQRFDGRGKKVAQPAEEV